MEYVTFSYGKQDGYKEEFEVVCKVVSAMQFAIRMMNECNGLTRISPDFLPMVIDKIRVNERITFKEDERELVISKFKEAFINS